SFRMLAHDSIAIVGLHRFSKQDDFDPIAFMDSAFRAIAKAPGQALILDLRPNHGGLRQTGAYLVSYIARDTFTYATRRAVRKRHYDFVQGFDGWWFNLQLRFRYASRRDSMGAFVLDEPLDRPQRPHSGGYHGRVIVLVDGTTVSTGTAVAAVLKHYQLATFGGGATGHGGVRR